MISKTYVVELRIGHSSLLRICRTCSIAHFI